ncbi:unnamed protein product [Fusarium fujikuroi]|nr:hypothetical protein CEK25_002117 [Fusarium fujikuroi]VZI00292.1 unnamed protein product [Fusarium fujikuroi]
MSIPNPQSFNFPTRHSVYVPFPVGSPYPFDPLRALLSPQNRPKDSPQGMLSPVCLASFQNAPKVIRFMRQFYIPNRQEDYDLALFLANREGHQEPASLLLEYHADPGRKNAANGLHGAAWRGLNGNMKKYINDYGANPDVTDGSSATPIIYAILGVQSEARAWKTIESLISYGASQQTRFGRASLSRESSCTVGRDDVDNEQDPEVDGGAGVSRESSCTVGRYDDIQPNNKRPREDSEANGGAKRAREV